MVDLHAAVVFLSEFYKSESLEIVCRIRTAFIRTTVFVMVCLKF